MRDLQTIGRCRFLREAERKTFSLLVCENHPQKKLIWQQSITSKMRHFPSVSNTAIYLFEVQTKNLTKKKWGHLQLGSKDITVSQCDKNQYFVQKFN